MALGLKARRKARFNVHSQETMTVSDKTVIHFQRWYEFSCFELDYESFLSLEGI